MPKPREEVECPQEKTPSLDASEGEKKGKENYKMNKEIEQLNKAYQFEFMKKDLSMKAIEILIDTMEEEKNFPENFFVDTLKEIIKEGVNIESFIDNETNLDEKKLAENILKYYEKIKELILNYNLDTPLDNLDDATTLEYQVSIIGKYEATFGFLTDFINMRDEHLKMIEEKYHSRYQSSVNSSELLPINIYLLLMKAIVDWGNGRKGLFLANLINEASEIIEKYVTNVLTVIHITKSIDIIKELADLDGTLKNLNEKYKEFMTVDDNLLEGLLMQQFKELVLNMARRSNGYEKPGPSGKKD